MITNINSLTVEYVTDFAASNALAPFVRFTLGTETFDMPLDMWERVKWRVGNLIGQGIGQAFEASDR